MHAYTGTHGRNDGLGIVAPPRLDESVREGCFCCCLYSALGPGLANGGLVFSLLLLLPLFCFGGFITSGLVFYDDWGPVVFSPRIWDRRARALYGIIYLACLRVSCLRPAAAFRRGNRLLCFARRMGRHWLVFKDQWNSVHYDYGAVVCLVCDMLVGGEAVAMVFVGNLRHGLGLE